MKRFFAMLSLFMGCLLCFWGCSGVEPEKRAYPQVLALDVAEGEYQIIYGMPNMQETTGQEKTAQDSQSRNLTFTGKDMEEIRKKYDETQEKYLDLGHVEVLILGRSLVESRLWEQIFSDLKRDSSIGEDMYLFYTEDITQIMEYNGTKTDSLGNYLIGIYENRPYNQGKRGVTLRQAYKRWFESGDLCSIPHLYVQEQGYLSVL